uniref:ABC-type branched-chain amino acid transport system, ATPase component n=1 Tax=Candidatus Kentrum sp. DK TaxID=2126562 RepID=A0A450S3L0_9GAMM|nr:MAG: ABC-type branched-chain amino acid transport system, ATPase component [Candidatus Kentron sp. DK]
MDSPILLHAQGLKKAFGGQIVLNELDLELRQGEVVLLRGENGSGKTTLLNILTGNLEPDAGTIHYLTGGAPRIFHFPRRWWQNINPLDHFTPESAAREGVSRTWQDVRLFNSQTLRDNIAVAEPGHPGENPILALFAPRLLARREKKINRKADAMLARLGLASREQSSADKISLGQSKRVAIARSVAAGARILFLDEPLAGLDRQGIDDVLALLGALVNEQQITLVIVEHIFNQRHLERLITTDWLLENGRIKNTGNVGWGERSEPQQKPELRQSHVGVRSSPQPTIPSTVIPAGNAGIQRQGWRANNPSNIAQHPPWFQLLTGDSDAVEVIDELLPRGALLTRIRRPGVFREPLKPVLECKGLVIARGKRIVIGLDEEAREESNSTGLDLALYEGEIAILQAPNGWGKSTLIIALAGFIPIQQGTILLQGNPIEPSPPWDRVRAGLRVLPSDRFIFPTLSGKEAIKLSGAGRGDDDAATTFTVEPPSLLARQYASLSGGERRQVSIAGFHGGVLGLCDEPFHALDGGKIQRAVRYLSEAVGTLLIAAPYQEER